MFQGKTKGKLWNYRKGDSRRAEKSRKVLMRTKAAKLGWARSGARPEQKHGRNRPRAGVGQEQSRSRGRKLGKIFFHVGKRENKFSHVGKTRKTRKNENLPYGPDETLKTLIIRF